MKYKALICDVDGTLIKNTRDSLPSSYLKEIVKKAHKKIYIGIATGRPIPLVKKIIDELTLSSPCILGNGVQIYDPISRKVLIEHRLPLESIRHIFDLVKSLGVESFVRDSKGRIPFTPSYQPQKPLSIFVPPLDEKLIDAFIKNINSIPNIICHRMVSWKEGKSDYLITHRKATKQRAVLEVAKILGIQTHEIIGVGDGHNDLPLLMACGFKVAMGNAVDELKAIADYISPTVEQDGVADVIEKFILS